MKANLYDAGTGVHLVMRGPVGFSGGKTCGALVSHIDLFPTICDLLEIRRPDWVQGKSFLPVIRGEQREVNSAIYTELNYHCSYEPKRAVRTKRWKYIRHYLDYPHPVLPNCDDGPSKNYWVKNGWGSHTIAREELFDLMFDPNERNNLADEASHRPVLEEMRTKLQHWMDTSSDPLLAGPIKAPRGARVNPPDQISPHDPTVLIT